MNEVTNLHWGVLCDQDQALNAFRRLHCHYRGNLSPQTVPKDVGFFDPQGVHGAQYSLSHLGPIESDTAVREEVRRNSPGQSHTVSSRVRLLSGRGSGGRWR